MSSSTAHICDSKSNNLNKRREESGKLLEASFHNYIFLFRSNLKLKTHNAK